MTKPMPLDQFARLPRLLRAEVVDGLSTALDTVAERAAQTHRFLRYQWFAAAIRAYGGRARTVIVHAEDAPELALPIVSTGPSWLRAAQVPGSYWPFRSFPLADNAGAEVIEAALGELARQVNVLRIGPVYDDDPAAAALVTGARAHGWAVVERTAGQTHLLHLPEAAADGWPRASSLRKNRAQERQLASQGAPEWRFLSAPDWPEAFDALARIEHRSWIETRTDGSGAKFTETGHGAFWRALAEDRVLAGMMQGLLLTVGDRPAAFCFNLSSGATHYGIATSYDPAFARYSPGRLLLYRNLAAALERGTTILDWGMGDGGYKSMIGATPGPMIRDWLLLRPGLPARLAPLARRMWRD
ncbi:MAG: GNAT family N-acetyltransferase [Sphingomonas bacterium]